MKTALTLSPYSIIEEERFDLELKHHPRHYIVHLMDASGARRATGTASRSGKVSVVQAMEKIRLNQWGPTTSMYSLTVRMAKLAKQLNRARAAGAAVAAK